MLLLFASYFLCCNARTEKETLVPDENKPTEYYCIIDTGVADTRIRVLWDSTGKLMSYSYDVGSDIRIDSAIVEVFGYTSDLDQPSRDSLLFDDENSKFNDVIIRGNRIYFSLADQFKQRASLFALEVTSSSKISFIGKYFQADDPLPDIPFIQSGGAVILCANSNLFFLLDEPKYSEEDTCLCRNIIVVSSEGPQFLYRKKYKFCESEVGEAEFSTGIRVELVQLMKRVIEKE